MASKRLAVTKAELEDVNLGRISGVVSSFRRLRAVNGIAVAVLAVLAVPAVVAVASA